MAHNEKGSKLLQFVAAITACICIMAGGSITAWPSPIFVMLLERPVNEDNPLGRPFNIEEISWIGSMILIGVMIGCLFPGYLAERWGRRTIMLSSIIPFFLSWVLIFTAKSIEVLYLARFFGGIASSVAFGVIPLYVGEVAEPSIRGVLGSFFQIFITLGLLWAYSIGPYVSYIHYCIACASLPIAFFILFYLMPESPYYLAAKGRKEDVIRVLVKLRGKSREAVEKEANEIEAAVQKAYNKETSFMDLFKVKANFKALIATCALVIFQQMSGISIVLFYSELIFASAGEISISSSLQTIIVGLVQFLGSCVNPLVVDRLGRKVLLIISCTGAALSLGILGLFFYLKELTEFDINNIRWLPIFALVTYMATYGVGLGSLPWTVMGEMFSQEIKPKASTIVVLTNGFMAFIVSKYFLTFTAYYGQFSAFWISGILCILCIVFTVFFLPETKGKSLQEIQDELNGKRRM